MSRALPSTPRAPKSIQKADTHLSESCHVFELVLVHKTAPAKIIPKWVPENLTKIQYKISRFSYFVTAAAAATVDCCLMKNETVY